MFNSKSGGLFGRRDPSAIAIVDAPVSQSYARKARVVFFVVGIAVAILSAVVLAHEWHPILGAVGGALLGVVAGAAAGVVVLAWPVLRAVWHWSAEIVLALLLVFGWTALNEATGILATLAVIVVLVGLPAAVPAARRRIAALVWCQISRHRLRLAFARIIRTGTRNHPGHLPLILFAKPTPAGERVWIWLRPGLDLSMVEQEIGRLAVTCWADSVRVVRANRSQAALIRVDVTRRDPLRATIASPIPDLIPDFDPADAPVSPGLPPLGLDLPDVPAPSPQPRPSGRPPRRSRTSDGDEGEQ